jgi:hypothetical protein
MRDMSGWIAETVPVSTARQFWEFYRQYTHTAIHAASAAALTIFGLLVFVDPLFAGVAIAAYVCPPLVLYALGADVGGESANSTSTDEQQNRTVSETDLVANSHHSDRDTDSDTDGVDGDSDSDGVDGDSDSDGSDGDSDSDSDSD